MFTITLTGKHHTWCVVVVVIAVGVLGLIDCGYVGNSISLFWDICPRALPKRTTVQYVYPSTIILSLQFQCAVL